jgi:hypothetical protein
MVDGYSWVFVSAALGLVAAAPVAWSSIKVDRRTFTSSDEVVHPG